MRRIFLLLIALAPMANADELVLKMPTVNLEADKEPDPFLANFPRLGFTQDDIPEKSDIVCDPITGL